MKIGEYLGKKYIPTQFKEDDYLVSNSDGVGVEIELENILIDNHAIMYDSYLKTIPYPFDLWDVVADGSLREGTEFIFKDAYFGINITNALSSLQLFLDEYKRNGSGVKISDRCSVHVHLDVRDLEDSQLNNLILLYLLVERVLFQHINPNRLKNNYCRPLSDSSFKYVLREMMYQSKNKNLPNLCHIVKRDCDKYSALNVLPISKFGSVEFRHHHGTSNMSDVKSWVNIILALKLAAKKQDISYYLSAYSTLGPIGALSVIFNYTELGDLTYLESLTDIKALFAKGVCDVKEILEMEQLEDALKNRSRSRVKKENTLLNKYKEVNVPLYSSEFNAGVA